MATLSPSDLVLRCYGCPTKEGRMVGVCLELNLAAEAENLEELKLKLNKVIKDYLESVYDTDDKASIPELLQRKAPLSDHLIYHAIGVMLKVKKVSNRIARFKESLPIHIRCYNT